MIAKIPSNFKIKERSGDSPPLVYIGSRVLCSKPHVENSMAFREVLTGRTLEFIRS